MTVLSTLTSPIGDIIEVDALGTVVMSVMTRQRVSTLTMVEILESAIVEVFSMVMRTWYVPA